MRLNSDYRLAFCSGEPLCLAFNKLPSKKEYPDYYVEIKRPISLDIMKSKISRDVYKSVSDFVSDIDLMCSNAQTYNMPESYIYEIAGDIR
ncbi:Bromodomain-containing protein, partial [Martensiomyces pterosporus]